MTQETFNLLNHFSCEGLDNSCYGFAQDVNTEDYFGTLENIELEGMYLYIYIRVKMTGSPILRKNRNIPLIWMGKIIFSYSSLSDSYRRLLFNR